MMFRIDRDGYYLDFKPAMEFEPYVPPSEFLGKNVSEVLPRSAASGAIRHIERALATKAIQTYEYTLPMGDELRHYEARITPLGEDDVLAVVRDITDRKLPKNRTSKELGLEAKRAYGLTKREVGVLGLMTIGMTDAEIAGRLGITPQTARKHVANIRMKMGTSSRTDASVRAVREGLF
jgi:DNA-binding CsgD family transcriptional regulator